MDSEHEWVVVVVAVGLELVILVNDEGEWVGYICFLLEMFWVIGCGADGDCS